MIVVDTSVLLKFVIPEPRSDLAAKLRDERLIASDIWIAEAGNAFWRKVLTKELTESQAARLLSLLIGGAVDTVASQGEIRTALQLAIALEHPIYDCMFLALAIRESTVVVTDDARFGSAVRKHGKWSANIKLLSEV